LRETAAAASATPDQMNGPPLQKPIINLALSADSQQQ